MFFENIESKFDYTDYIVFGLMFITSMTIGLIFSRKSKKQTNNDENDTLNYLVGNRKLSMIPVSISLIATAITGGGMIGNATEEYLYGYHLLFNLISLLPVGVLGHYWFLPVLYDLKLVSMYEYFEQRFDSKTRWMCSILFLVNCVS